MNQWWSWCLTAVGVFGLYLAGKKSRWGWAVGIGAQTLWIAYAVFTRQWGFLFSAFAYGFVYVKNFRSWRTKKTVESTSNGVHVLATEMAHGYIPPSGSLNSPKS